MWKISENVFALFKVSKINFTIVVVMSFYQNKVTPFYPRTFKLVSLLGTERSGSYLRNNESYIFSQSMTNA